VSAVGEEGGGVNVSVGGVVGSGDAVKVGIGVSVWEAGWKGVTVTAFGSRVGRMNCAKGSGVGVGGVGAAQERRKMEIRK